jgi:hypothetical protein
MTRLWIDHAIYAVGDLDAAGDQIYEREGLASVPGGRHEGWGTANRIVPLGEAYLELIAVVDAEEAESSDFGRAVLRAVTEDRPFVGWVVATDDIEGVARRLDLEVERKSRSTPDGSTLSWRLAGLEVAPCPSSSSGRGRRSSIPALRTSSTTRTRRGSPGSR